MPKFNVLIGYAACAFVLAILWVLSFGCISWANVYKDKIESFGPEFYTCTTDVDCSSVRSECCGDYIAISKKFVNRWNFFLKYKCHTQTCMFDDYLLADEKPVCQAGHCQIPRAISSKPIMVQDKAPLKKVMPQEKPRLELSPAQKDVKSHVDFPSKETVLPKPQSSNIVPSARRIVVTSQKQEFPNVPADMVVPQVKPVAQEKMPAPSSGETSPSKIIQKPQEHKTQKPVNVVRIPETIKECMEIYNQSKRERCLWGLVERGNTNADICQYFREHESVYRDRCYFKIADMTRDLFYCKDIDDADNRFSCYHQETLYYVRDFNECKVMQKANPDEYVKGYIYGTCVTAVAVNRQKPEICDEITNTGQFYPIWFDCNVQVLKKLHNPDGCKRIDERKKPLEFIAGSSQDCRAKVGK